MAEDSTKNILDIIAKNESRIVQKITLIFAIEEGLNGPLWLLGASRLDFIEERKLFKKKRLSVRENKPREIFMLIPRKSVDSGLRANTAQPKQKNISALQTLEKQELQKIPEFSEEFKKLEKMRPKSVLAKHTNLKENLKLQSRNKLHMNMIIKSYKNALEIQGRTTESAHKVSKNFETDNNISSGRKTAGLLSKSYERKPNLHRKIVLIGEKRGSEAKENTIEKIENNKNVEISSVQFINIEKNRNAIRYMLKKRDPMLYENIQSNRTSINNPSNQGSQKASFIKNSVKMKLCAGDFCKNSVSSVCENSTYCLIDETLIYLARTKYFSPQFNSEIRKIHLHSPTQSKYSQESQKYLLKNMDLHEENVDCTSDNDLIKFQVEVKGTIEDDFLNSILKRIRHKVILNPGIVDKLPGYAGRLLKKGPLRKVEVCFSCKQLYTKVAKYLATIILEES